MTYILYYALFHGVCAGIVLCAFWLTTLLREADGLELLLIAVGAPWIAAIALLDVGVPFTRYSLRKLWQSSLPARGQYTGSGKLSIYDHTEDVRRMKRVAAFLPSATHPRDVEEPEPSRRAGFDVGSSSIKELNSMVRHGLITAEEAAKAFRRPLKNEED